LIFIILALVSFVLTHGRWGGGVVWEQKGIFGPKREELIGGWRKIHKERLDNSYTSSNIVRVFKSRRISRMSYVARQRDDEMDTEFSRNS
jgi:hypothetical protein